MNLKSIRLLIPIAALILAGCGGGSAPEAEAPAAASEPEAAASPSASSEVLLKPVGNEMRYEQTTFEVSAGQEVTLTFENIADSPAMVHNVVILNTDAEDVVQRVGTNALAVGEAGGYIPEDDAIVAYTPLAQPGETVTVTFTAPSEPGNYTYLCTFPGHYVLMQGTMVVS